MDKGITRGLNRVYAPFTDEELDDLDNWGFSNRIRERSQVIRRLALEGLANRKVSEAIPTAGSVSQT